MKTEIINYGKKIIALFMLLFFILSYAIFIGDTIHADPFSRFEAKEKYGQSVDLFYISKDCFTVLILFIILELSNFFLSRIQKLKNILRFRNIIFLFIIAIILFFIMSFYPKAVVIIQPFYLFLLLFIILSGVIWSLKQLIYTFKTRISILIILAIIIFLIPLFLQNYHVELFYRAIGKIVIKEINVPRFGSTTDCWKEMPKGCKYIRREFKEFKRIEGRLVGWDDTFPVYNCFYGCPRY